MDPKFLRYYERELQYIREMGGEFARQFPRIAGRLGLEGFDCADPYVERLLEGFAFLAARIQLKIDAEFPYFTRQLLQTVYPDFLSPVPSMAVVRFEPDLGEGSLAEGFKMPRGTVLRSPLGKGERTACEYRTAQDVVLWPVRLSEAEYFTHARDIPELKLPGDRRVEAGFRFRLQATAGLKVSGLSLDRLTLFLQGVDELPMRVYEMLAGHALAAFGRPVGSSEPGKRWYDPVAYDPVRPVGFLDSEALLPRTLASFQGYRLLREYFTFPQRFLFVELKGLAPILGGCEDDEIDLIVLVARADPELQNKVDAGNFALNCTPAINLFSRRADRIHLDDRTTEYHVVPDRTRPLDYEVYEVTGVVGYGTSAEDKRQFLPLYAATDRTGIAEQAAYYTVERQSRLPSGKQKREGSRSDYHGSEVFVSIVDAQAAPYPPALRQLEVGVLCTNRDLPLHLAVGAGRTDFTMEASAPVESIRCIAGPSRPHPSHAEGPTAWRTISHLSLNYLSLTDSADGSGAAALRDMLRLYGDFADSAIAKQIDGLLHVDAAPVIARLPVDGPISFGRGLRVRLRLDEAAFQGSGVFLLASVLEDFLARYVSINSFTETVLETKQRGEIKRWPPRRGRRPKL